MTDRQALAPTLAHLCYSVFLETEPGQVLFCEEGNNGKQSEALFSWQESHVCLCYLMEFIKHSIVYDPVDYNALYPLSFQEVCAHQASSHPKRIVFWI